MAQYRMCEHRMTEHEDFEQLKDSSFDHIVEVCNGFFINYRPTLSHRRL